MSGMMQQFKTRHINKAVNPDLLFNATCDIIWIYHSARYNDLAILCITMTTGELVASIIMQWRVTSFGVPELHHPLWLSSKYSPWRIRKFGICKPLR